MVGVDDSSIQADSQHKSVDLVSARSQPLNNNNNNNKDIYNALNSPKPQMRSQ